MQDDDLEIIIGARPIGGAMGVTERQVYRMIYDCQMPVFRLGGSVAIRRAKLRQWLEEREAAPLAANTNVPPRRGRGRPRKAA